MPSIKLSSIQFRSDARALDLGTVKQLSESMGDIGLLNPISVRKVDGHFELCAGYHRFEAAKALGWEEISAVVADFDDLDAELVMIDENLCRAELSPADRARYTARRKAIYLEKHPETAEHVAGGKGNQTAEKFSAVPSFAADTAAKTGQTDRVVRLHAERGEKVAADVLRQVKGTHLDNGVYLDALKKLSHDDQRNKVAADLKAEKKRRNRRKGKSNTPPQLHDDDVEDRQFAALMSAWNKASATVRQRFREEIDTLADADEENPQFLARAQ